MVIYNAKSDEIVALTPGLANIFEEKKCDYKESQTLYPELCSYPPEFGLSNSPFFFDGFNIKRRLFG